jgi:predicted RecA/RadA family phage recombinase
MRNFVSDGIAPSITAETDVKSGDLIVVGDLVGFAQADALAGEQVGIVTEGIFRVDVNSISDIAVGDVIYVDFGTLTTDGAGKRAGVATQGGTSVNGIAADVHVKLNA